MQKTIVSILGRPLSGKDTVAHAIEHAFPNVAVISMGDVLRDVRASGSAHKYWNLLEESARVAMSGGISPDEPMFQCLTELILEQQNAGKEIFVWPGALRTEKQIDMLDTWSKVNGFREVFIHLDVPDEEILKRRDERLVLKREDDGEKEFEIRLHKFDEQTRPVIERLTSEGRLLTIDGYGRMQEVARRVIDTLVMHGFDPEVRLPSAARR